VAIGRKTVGRDLLGVFQKDENEEDMLDIQKREGLAAWGAKYL
jgi:hypothetical protein